MATPPVAVHAWDAMVRLQAAALPLASNTVLPMADIAAIGLSADLTALSALTMPAPHWPETHEHSPGLDPVLGTTLGHTGRFPVFAGNGVALDSMRAIN